MKTSGYRRLGALSFMHRSLIVCLITLGVIILGGTVYGVFFRTDTGIGRDNPSGQAQVLRPGQGQTFTGLGRMRIPTADPQPGIVILFVTFPYYPDDRAFSEELALRVRDLRDIIREYVGSLSAAELRGLNEDLMRAELLRRFNAILRLGRIETLFFSDFMISG